MFYEIYFLFEFLVPYSNIINIVFAVIFLFILKYFYNKKHLCTFITVFILSMVFFIVCLDSVLPSFIEKIKNETPQAKIELYLQAVSKGDKEEALTLWEFPNWWDSSFVGFNQLKDRREKITNRLIGAKINSDFTITKIDWWNTCCMPSIIDDSNRANGVRVYVQLIDSDDNKLNYVFDVFVLEDREKLGIGDSIRHWILRDVYSENEEPLFWTMKNE